MPNGISTIRDFYKVAMERDFARKNQIRVLAINSGAGLSVSFTPDDLVYVKAAKLPTAGVTTSQAKFMGLGFNIPGNVEYSGSESYTLTFFADQRFQLWEKLDGWRREVFDDESSSGNYFTPKASAVIDLVLIDNELNPIKKVSLVGVVCKKVGELEYTIEDSGAIQEFTVTFSFHFTQESDI